MGDSAVRLHETDHPATKAAPLTRGARQSMIYMSADPDSLPWTQPAMTGFTLSSLAAHECTAAQRLRQCRWLDAASGAAA